MNTHLTQREPDVGALLNVRTWKRPKERATKDPKRAINAAQTKAHGKEQPRLETAMMEGAVSDIYFAWPLASSSWFLLLFRRIRSMKRLGKRL